MIHDFLPDDVVNGEVISSAYFIRYSEDPWLAFNESQQDFCKQFWISRAKPLEVEEVVLQLIPDELFPMYGREKPYITWRHKFPKTVDGEWSERITVHLNSNSDLAVLTADDRSKMQSYFAKYPKGTKFILRNLQEHRLWEHTT